jgi:integrase
MTATIIELRAPRARQRAASRRMALTEQRVADLKDPGFVFDTRTPGLAVRITPSGTKSYVFQRKVDGRPLRVTLGKCAGLRLDAARDAAAQYNGKAAAGVDLRGERAARRRAAAAPRPATLDAAFAVFKKSKQRRASTVRDYETLWRLHVPARLKSKPVADVSADDLERLKGQLLTAPKSGGVGRERTAAKVITLIGSILNRAGRRSDNPAREVEKPETRVRTRRLSAAELAAMLEALEVKRGDLFADFIAIAVLTGARRGALCAMRWRDLDLNAGVWTVPADWSKNRREIAVPLPAKAVEILLRRKTNDQKPDWVWPSSKAACGHIVNPEKPLSSILKSAGVSRVTMHDLRRTLGSRLAMTGAGASAITAALGHISPQSARAYVHLDIEHTRAAMEKALNA